jgi:hypothetical protein
LASEAPVERRDGGAVAAEGVSLVPFCRLLDQINTDEGIMTPHFDRGQSRMWVLLELLDDFFENFPYKFSYARKPEKTVQ